jgi:hypothetical protein
VQLRMPPLNTCRLMRSPLQTSDKEASAIIRV